MFRFCIVRFGLKTPGREPEEQASAVGSRDGDANRARGFVDALGGAANLGTVDACTTRLRLVLAALGGRANVRSVEATAGRVLIAIADGSAVDEPALQSLGLRGVARPSAGSVHLLDADAALLQRELNALVAPA